MDLSGLLQSVLTELKKTGGPDVPTLRGFVEKQGPPIVEELLPTGYSARGSVGQPPHFADVPWIGVWPPGTDAPAYSGFYLVYLFAADGSAAFLSLNQGTEKVRGGKKPLAKRAGDLRAAAGLN